jgi:hypothetical protein
MDDKFSLFEEPGTPSSASELAAHQRRVSRFMRTAIKGLDCSAGQSSDLVK